jgi:hypothetical protein
MRRIFLTTVKRGEKKSITGFLYEINWKRGKAKKIAPILEPTIKKGFWNPRGGNRGGRGIKLFNNVLYVATATTIRKYDSKLNHIGTIRNNRFKGLHDILIDREGIIASSTAYDLIIKVDFSGKTIWEKRFHDKRLLKDSLHLNNICRINNEIYFLSNKKKGVYRVVVNNKKKLFRDINLQHPHDVVQISSSEIMVNNTTKQKLHIYNFKTGNFVRSINTRIYNIGTSKHFASPGWQRGLTHFFGDSYLVGTSPLTLFSVNIKSNKIGKIVKLDKSIAHCSYDICVTTGF